MSFAHYIETRVGHQGNRRHYIAIAVMTILILTAFPAWILPGQYGLDDLSHLNAPQRMLLPWFYLHGHWPLWNPFSFAGQPFLAAGQSGPLYLPNVVFLLMPISSALKLSYVLHEWLAAFGMYLAVWRLGRRHLAAISAAVSFATSGFLVGHLIHTQMFDAMTWLPLLFWLELRLLDNPTKRGAAWLALAFALEVYAGHPQITFFVLLTLASYALLHGIQHPRKQVWRGILTTALALSLGGILAAAQLLPTLNLVSYSNRSDASSLFLLNGSWPWSALIQFLSPFPAGGGYTGQPFSRALYNTLFQTTLYWEYTAYVGIFSVVLGAAVAVRDFARNEVVRNIFIIGLLAIFLALGENSGAGSFLAHTPGFDLFRIPARYVGIADFSISLLFGLALASMQNNAAEKRLTISIGLSSIVFLGLLMAGIVLGPLKLSPSNAFFVPAGLLSALILASLVSRFIPAKWLIYSIALAGMCDSVYQASFMSQLTLVPKASYTHPSGAVKYLKAHLPETDPFTRVAAFSNQSSLYLDMPAAYQIPALNGYDSLEPSWYAQRVDLTWWPATLLGQPRSLLDELGVKYVATGPGGTPFLPTRTQGIQTFRRYIPALPQGTVSLVLNVTDVLQPKGTASIDPYSPLFSVTLASGVHAITYSISGNQATEYSIPIPASWPRHAATEVIIQNQSWTRLTVIQSMWLTDSARTHQNQVQIHQIFGPKAFSLAYKSNTEELWQNPDSTQAAWVSRGSFAPLLHSGTATLESWSPNKQSWQVNSPSGGTFVLSQMYDPNWRATIDGASASVTPVDHVLTGVQVPSGTHKITLVYKPKAFTFGLATSAVGLIIWLSLFVRKRKTINAKP